jgi:hypothetical protein
MLNETKTFFSCLSQRITWETKFIITNNKMIRICIKTKHKNYDRIEDNPENWN